PPLVRPPAAWAVCRRSAGREGRRGPGRDHEPGCADRPRAMRVAILGPGGVGGLLAGALDRAGTEVIVVARSSTTGAISERGLRVDSVRLGEFVAHPRA